MSSPRRRKPRKRGLSRREFMKRGGASLAALGLAPTLPGCSDGDGARSPNGAGGGGGGGGGPGGSADPVFRHGVASGDPLSDRVILWTRITQAGSAAVPVDVIIARDPALTLDARALRGSATPARDFTAKFDVDGLAPGTTYYYRFRALGQDSAIGRTRTLPVGAVARLRMAVLSCASYAHGYFNAYARVAARADLDVVLHLGDYVYEYGNGEYGNLRTYEPAHEVVSLEDYRTRHAYYKLEPELQSLHRQHATICVWDDHESANDAWRDGAENHQSSLEGAWPPRKTAAQRAYEEWMPIRAPDPARIFRQFKLGTLVDLLMLDTRLFARSQQLAASIAVPGVPFGAFTATGAFTDPTRTLLGDEQEQWLLDRLRTSTATWKLLGQQVMVGQLKLLGAPNATGLSQFLNPDQWDGYPVARSRIFAALRGDATHARIDNAVVLTGDIHTAWAMDLTEDPNNPLALAGGYDVVTGDGSLAVEFVATSVTSPGLDDLGPVQDALRLNNPHLKYVDLARKGYLLLDITPERCQGEFWTVDTVTARSANEQFQAAFQALAGSNRLSMALPSMPPVDAPSPAPGTV